MLLHSLLNIRYHGVPVHMTYLTDDHLSDHLICCCTRMLLDY